MALWFIRNRAPLPFSCREEMILTLPVPMGAWKSVVSSIAFQLAFSGCISLTQPNIGAAYLWEAL